MRRFFAVALMLALLGWLVPALPGAAAGQLYTCGMHPQIIQDHPGNCPICGMKLTPIRREGEVVATNTPGIMLDAASRQYMNLRIAEVQRGPLQKTIRTVGAIDYNETTLAEVTTKFRGWIEKLNVDATGQLVHRGEPMFEIYSPELYSAEAEFLLALGSGGTNDPGAVALRETAVNKLKFFDVSDEQIASLEQTRVPRKTMPVMAPMSGFVIEKNIVSGQMVDAGMKLYRLADLGIVWVLAQIYEQDLPYLQLGQEVVVKVASLPDREFRGRVTFIYPNVDEKTRTARVRLEFENPGYFLKPGMFVSAQIHADLEATAVLVPDAAVLRSGARNTVFIARDDGKFEARDVVLGVEAEGGLQQVISGLTAGERVVTSGQFLLDSESQLREAIDKMRGSTARADSSATNAPMIEAATALAAQPQAEVTSYVCPMPEHVSILYDHPGKCPICDMTLVAITKSVLAKIQPGGKVLYYTCPMPEHASVHEDKPGKCPICAMTLIPVMARPETKAATMYTCPMHPEVLSDKPGICPKCEMDLVPVKPK
jgi:membrane fusion protein, copper/silver efflux system